MIKHLIHIALLCTWCNALLLAQSKAVITTFPQTSELDIAVIKEFKYVDTLQLVNQINAIVNDLHAEGYLLANLANLEHEHDSLVNIALVVGMQFEWAKLKAGNIPENLQSKVGFRERFFKNSPFKVKEVNVLYKRIVTYSQNNGYPFASVSLDSITIEGNSISASIDYVKGPLITFDSLEIAKDLGVKRAWLQAYLGVLPGTHFNQASVDKINQKISKLKYLELESSPSVTFKNEMASITLNLKKIRSNTVDGIVGFLPNEKPDGSTLVTGQFDMEVNNLFSSGKSFDVHWQSLKPKSQLLEIGYLHRNLFHSPLHFEASFYLLKEDTTFINRRGEFSFRYQPSSHELSLFTRLESSRVLGESNNLNNDVELADFNINYYGLSYLYNQVKRTRVYKGLSSYLELAIGDKKIKNRNSLSIDPADSLLVRSSQYRFQGDLRWYRPLSKSLGTLVKVSGGKLINQHLFLNDLFRLGGLQSLRGFNENFFFASEYFIGTIEMRLHYDQNSFLFAFYDQGYIYYNLGENKLEDYPLGVGLGLSLQTGNGTLNLAYALGKSQELDQPLSLRLSKFHFGYVAKF